MIKLIASDMDGTLLKENGELPNNFKMIFSEMQAQGVVFAAASGRQYYNLLEKFADYAQEMLFLAENGTLVMHRGEELYTHALPLATARELIQLGRTVENSCVILCGKNAAYVETSEPRFIAEIEKYYARYEIVSDLLAVEDTILKVTMCDFTSAQTNSLPVFAEYVEQLQVSVSGKIWLDVTNQGANKGKAMAAIQERLGISFEETMVFGDFLNDLELMGSAYHSYAMQNAHPELKAAARFVSPLTNEEEAVTQIIATTLQSQKKCAK
ncbi:MAG: Cof-type HAD-IIB family hydrolase [Culicoidibacterales bacterium]